MKNHINNLRFVLSLMLLFLAVRPALAQNKLHHCDTSNKAAYVKTFTFSTQGTNDSLFFILNDTNFSTRIVRIVGFSIVLPYNYPVDSNWTAVLAPTLATIALPVASQAGIPITCDLSQSTSVVQAYTSNHAGLIGGANAYTIRVYAGFKRGTSTGTAPAYPYIHNVPSIVTLTLSYL